MFSKKNAYQKEIFQKRPKNLMKRMKRYESVIRKLDEEESWKKDCLEKIHQTSIDNLTDKIIGNKERYHEDISKILGNALEKTRTDSEKNYMFQLEALKKTYECRREDARKKYLGNI